MFRLYHSNTSSISLESSYSSIFLNSNYILKLSGLINAGIKSKAWNKSSNCVNYSSKASSGFRDFSEQVHFKSKMASTTNIHALQDKKGMSQSKTTSIVWFRNDLRVHDNEALIKAYKSSDNVLPLYCFDPRHFGKTSLFGFPKTGELRAQFLLESVENLRQNLQSIGSNLIIRHGYPEKIIPQITQNVNASKVYAQKETCSEEISVENAMKKALNKISIQKNKDNSTTVNSDTETELILIWGTTMYHLDDIPFSPSSIPDVYTQFRKKIELNCTIRESLTCPKSFGKFPGNIADQIEGLGNLPSLSDFGLEQRNQHSKGVMHFKGGETAALARLENYFWEKDLLKIYKETRNGMLGDGYSTKFSPWLAFGCISPRYIHNQVKKYEKERVANESTYWVLFELIWRDYFRFISMKYGNSIFHLGGPRNVNDKKWRVDWNLFEAWKDGQTGYPLIDANMRELYETGFMSNRGRQIVCSFLVRDMGVDWRMGAEWFESLLLDYDPCSNYGNWTYGAGVGNDPREDRYFSIPKQASSYDADGEYVSHWIPELSKLPPKLRNFTFNLSPSEKALHGLSVPGIVDQEPAYPNPIVSLKHGQSVDRRNNGPSGGRGNSRFGGKGRGRSGQSAKF